MRGLRRLLNPTLSYQFDEYLTSTRIHIARCLEQQGWWREDEDKVARLRDCHLNMNDVITAHLEQKHLLWSFLKRHHLNFMPRTYPVNDFTYYKVIEDINADDLKENKAPFWFLKPSLMNNAEYIYLFNHAYELKNYFQHPRHLEGEHVFQQAVHPPALIGGRKFTFRMGVVITNEPSAYLYRTGYLNISTVDYNDGDDLTHRKRHITNYLDEFGELAGIEQRLTSSYPEFNEKHLPEMVKMIHSILTCLNQEFPNYLINDGTPKIELLGIDFILDKKERLWLLEINQGPDFPVDPLHPLYESLWDPFWHRLVDDFVKPLFKLNQTHRAHWLKIY